MLKLENVSSLALSLLMNSSKIIEEYPAKEKDEVTILKEGTLPLTQNCLPVAMATPKPTRSTILHERMEK